MKCAVYIRVSTDKEEQKTSLENQQRFFYNVMAEKGWELFQFYVDVESGTSSKKRTMLLKLIEDAKQKKFDVILSKELSRLARNGKLSYEIKEVAENNRIHIITFDNAINSVENNSNMFGLYAWIYEQESQRTSERIKIAFNTKARRGEFNGSVPPYGYTLKNKQLFISDNDTPDVVRYIFNKYIDGVGYDAIARSLSKKGIPTPSTIANKSNKSKYWIGSSIKKILTNPHYVGDLVQRREETVSVTSVKRRQIDISDQIVIPNTHEAIISRENFDLVQQLIRQRRQKRPKSSQHLFTNFLFCADCESGLWYRSNRKGYICGSYSRHGKIACSKHLVSEQYLIDYILKQLNTAAYRFQKNSSDFFEEEAIKQSKEIQEEIEVLANKLEQFKIKKRKYLDLLSEDVITHQEYRSAIESLNGEEKELNIKKSELNCSLQLTLVTSKMNSHLQKQLQDAPFLTLTKQLLATFVKRIDVSENGELNVQYHSPFLAALVSPV